MMQRLSLRTHKLLLGQVFPDGEAHASPLRSGLELGRELAEGRAISGARVTELAHDGDAAARAAVDEVGRWLGLGLSGLANVFDPEVIVVGGGVARAGELLLEPARASSWRARCRRSP